MNVKGRRVVGVGSFCYYGVMKLGPFELEEPLPDLKSPHALVMLRPWVDVGNVGSLTLAHLESALAAQPLGRLGRPGNFFDFTRYRPTAFFKEGRREVALPNATIMFAKREGANDFLFLHLLEPHMFGEAYVQAVLRVLRRFSASRYCLLGAMYDAVPHTRPLLISGSASTQELQQHLERFGVGSSHYEGPTSITIVLSQEAARLGMETMGLIVHLPQYAQFEEDYAGALCILEVLADIYGLPLEATAIREKAQAQQRQLDAAMARNRQMRELVEQLEELYERRSQEATGPAQSPPLSSEIEKFLRELGTEP